MRDMLLRPGLFLLALVCFILPFQEYSCSHKPYIHVRGTDLAFGAKVDTTMLVPEYRAMLSDTSKLTESAVGKQVNSQKLQVIEVAPLILASFICCSLAMLIGLFVRKPGGSWLAALLGIAAIILLFIYYFDQIRQNNTNNSLLEVSTRFLYGFWLAMVFMGLGSLYSILFALKRPARITDNPPAETTVEEE